ncbi:integrase [Streptomyces sp. NPDC057621]|uniref:integrase n=1 Tax=Streptomyces sp. NPDC057621 TaxID=3346186 RepID=UPI00367BEC37
MTAAATTAAVERASLVVRRAPRGVLVRGDTVHWRGSRHTVAGLDGRSVHLVPEGGDRPPVSVLLVMLAAAADFAVLDEAGQPVVQAELPDFAALEGVPAHAAEAAQQWWRAVIEVDTGLPPGAAPGARPRSMYAPDTTTFIERYQAKAAELHAVLGWSVSWQTVQAKRLAYRKKRTVAALVDGRSTKLPRLYGLTDAGVVDQLLILVDRQRRRLDAPSDARKLFKQLRRAVRAAYGVSVKVPAEPTLYKLLQRLGIDARDLGGNRGGRRLTGPGPVPPFSVTSATMPGELVQIDSTDLDIWVLGDDGQPARVELTCAVDVATRSIIAAVVRPKQSARRGKRRQGGQGGLVRAARRKGRATKAVDACELLAQSLVPAPMRPGFDAVVHASASTLPYEELAAVDARFAQAAARPVIIPDLIVIDHGTVFAGRTFFDACEYLGISVRPARKRTGPDKAVVERTFGSVKSMFSQHVNTYTGNDPVRVRRTVDGERLWTLAELDDMLQQWIALEWQNKPHPELADPYDAYLPELTPNEMYAACVAVEGYLPIPLTRDDYLRLLPTAWVGVSDQGIRFSNRTYDHPERDPNKGLNACRRTSSGLRGKKKGRWELRYTPNDPSRVWLRNHLTSEWVEATWVHQHVVGRPFTQFLWDIAVSQHLERGGRITDEEAIAHALAELLERAARGPDRIARMQLPDGYSPAPQPAPAVEFDPYAGRAPLSRLDLLPDPPAELDDDPLSLGDTGLYATGQVGGAIDWESGPVAPDASLAAWEGAPPGEEGGGEGADLTARYRRIIAEIRQRPADSDSDGDDPDDLR